MDQAAILKRITELRDEIELVVRENLAYDAYYTRTVKEKNLKARMLRLQEIKRELDDMKTGKFQEANKSRNM